MKEKIPSPSQKEKVKAEHECDHAANDPALKIFFEILHKQLKSASDFVQKAEELFHIRELRVRNGVTLTKMSTNRLSSNDALSKAALTVAWLYKDLMSLETFAIMTFCCFSKILKKLDKKTGLLHGNNFMNETVKKAYFTHYPRTRNMIQATHTLYEDVKKHLPIKDNINLLTEQSLFIDAITRLKGGELPTLSQRSRRISPLVTLTPHRQSEAPSTPLSIRSKIGIWDTQTAEENNNFDEIPSEFVTHASVGDVKISSDYSY